jgi:hypothetical protein
MVPRTSRGHSFAGASMYYFHDKEAQTTNRVEWSETYNIPTQDHDKAIKWMQYTAMNADKMKQEMGVPMTGRKSTKGATYTYSLSWHKEETPDKEHMKGCLLETLAVLGLQDHEAIFVAHNDTEHPHVHAIVNLVSPIDGKMNTVYNDQKKLSKWAEAYEQEHGVYCNKRIENNKNRGIDLNNEKKLRHKEEQLKRAQLVHDLYAQSENGIAFKAAMKDQGFDLTAGKRRAFSFVDEQGKIYSLSRHINAVIDKEKNPKWRSEMKKRFNDLDLEEADSISKAKKEEWEEQQHKINDITSDAKKVMNDPLKKSVLPENGEMQKKQAPTTPKRFKDSYTFLKELDKIREAEKRKELKDKWDKSKQKQNFLKKQKVESTANNVNDNTDEKEAKRKEFEAKILESRKKRDKARGRDNDYLL